ncbi:MAG: J domain-containing protein [Dehalococcoidia bacterium]|jgi:molecular chaperone DnaJ|nr:MAG: J domain-containing protein [Dehalococcoidia bacterium]
MAKKDYYATLGVSRSATEKDIKQAFRKLARKYHPDVNPGSKDAEAKFKEINEAFEVLSDKGKRQKYDQYGEKWQFAEQFAGAQQGQGTPHGFRYSTGGASPFADVDIDSLFGDLFGGMRGRRAPRPRRGQDVEHPIEVTLEEAFSGSERTMVMEAREVCPTCRGAGGVKNVPCSTCGGAGYRPATKRLQVKIPPGVRTGSRIRLAGKGGAGEAGAASGDLYLLVTVKPHPRFERRDDDLLVEVPVPLTAALLGGEVKVPTLKGNLALKVPPETQNGRSFKLAGQGMPRLGNATRGDLFATVKVVLPTRLSKEEKHLIEKLAGLRPSPEL